jgi:hypothetical protein
MRAQGADARGPVQPVRHSPTGACPVTAHHALRPKGFLFPQVSALTSYELPYQGHEGYKKAEVTGGGVRLEEVDCATMESRVGRCGLGSGRVGWSPQGIGSRLGAGLAD